MNPFIRLSIRRNLRVCAIWPALHVGMERSDGLPFISLSWLFWSICLGS